MPGIALDTIAGFQNRVATLNAYYIADWSAWLVAPAAARPVRLGETLRKWQACRPNRMRRERVAAAHVPPYLEDLVAAATPHIAALNAFDISNPISLTNAAHITALNQLWEIFEQLSYQGRARGGLAGSVGISKAVMLLTDGRVGPAFDSEVKNALGLPQINSAAEWRAALSAVCNDIQAFERTNLITFAAAKPALFGHLQNGRVYDMALGPR